MTLLGHLAINLLFFLYPSLYLPKPTMPIVVNMIKPAAVGWLSVAVLVGRGVLPGQAVQGHVPAPPVRNSGGLFVSNLLNSASSQLTTEIPDFPPPISSTVN